MFEDIKGVIKSHKSKKTVTNIKSRVIEDVVFHF